MNDEASPEVALAYLLDALVTLGKHRTELGREHILGRNCSVAITELEKLIAYVSHYLEGQE